MVYFVEERILTKSLDFRKAVQDLVNGGMSSCEALGRMMLAVTEVPTSEPLPHACWFMYCTDEQVQQMKATVRRASVDLLCDRSLENELLEIAYSRLVATKLTPPAILAGGDVEAEIFLAQDIVKDCEALVSVPSGSYSAKALILRAIQEKILCLNRFRNDPSISRTLKMSALSSQLQSAHFIYSGSYSLGMSSAVTLYELCERLRDELVAYGGSCTLSKESVKVGKMKSPSWASFVNIDQEVSAFFGSNAPKAYSSIFDEGNAAAHGSRFAMGSASQVQYKAPPAMYLTLKDMYGEASEQARDLRWTGSILTVLFFVATLESIAVV